MRFAIVLLLFAFDVAANVLHYKQIVIGDEDLEFCDIKFNYDFLSGSVHKLNLRRAKKELKFSNAKFEFQDTVGKKWVLDVEQGLFGNNGKWLSNISITAEDDALISIDTVQLQDAAKEDVNFVVKNVYLTPCRNMAVSYTHLTLPTTPYV